MIIPLLLLASFCAFGDVYKRTGKDGSTYYTDTPIKNITYKKIIKTGEDTEIAKKAYAKKYPIGKTEKEKSEQRHKLSERTIQLRRKLSYTQKTLNEFYKVSEAIGYISTRRHDELSWQIHFLNKAIKANERNYIANGGTKLIFDSMY